MSTNPLGVKHELWAQYYTVGPEGWVGTDGLVAVRPTADEAAAICADPDQLDGIAWVDFSLVVKLDGEEADFYRTGESFIATSQRSFREIRFAPVASVIEQGRVTKHTANWLGHLASGNHEAAPDRFEELLELLGS